MNDLVGWSDAELAASVAAYRRMQTAEANGVPYVKRAIYRELVQEFGRTDKAFEFRMQNISAVLESLGKPWLSGLRPAAHVGGKIASRLRTLLHGTAPVGYTAKLPTMRHWLIQVARMRTTATYGALMTAFNIDRFTLRAALGRLGHEARNKGEPIITALIVNQKTGKCSPGLEKEFGISDDDRERDRLYDFWRDTDAPEPVAFDEFDDSLEARAAKFARVKLRPHQARFRKLVYLACGGKCVLTGCSLDRAVDAAHLKGRDWQKGQSRASDGVLLRKDLHGLYDAGLVRFAADGTLDLDEAVEAHYPELIKARWKQPGSPNV